MRFHKTVLAFVLSAALSIGAFLAPLTPIALPVTVAGIVVTQTACPKKENLVFWAEQTVGAFSDVLPILAANGRDTTKVQQAVDYGRKLIAALKANDGTALGYAASTIKLLEEIAADSKFIPDPARRTTALVILAVANVALHRIADSLKDSVPAGLMADSDAQVIQVFAQKKQWRCRDSISGQFRKMEVCKLNPSTTTVETY